MNTSYQHILISVFSKIKYGELVLELPDGTHRFFGTKNHSTSIHLKINHEEFFKRVLLQNDIGLGESYMLGQWECDDIAGLLKLLIQNRPYLNNRLGIFSGLIKKSLHFINRIQHLNNQNTQKQSEQNIHAHYDLGNNFYSHFLDESMTYSSAFFSEKNQSLTDAQTEKYDRICRKLAIGHQHHVLETGSGWGGFALHASLNYNCKITTITISRQQFDYVKRKIEAHQLQDRVEVLYKDYRTLDGSYDRIVSIEMLEAVGHKYLSNYFKTCSRLLKPNGLLALQVILTPDSRYSTYEKGVDFIRKHIFPGGHLPSITSINKHIGNHSDWDMLHYESFGMHYAETLRRWNKKFKESEKQRRQLGFDEGFDRKWEFYFKYCEAGFDSRHIQVGQLIYGSPNNSEYNFEHNEINQFDHQKIKAQSW